MNEMERKREAVKGVYKSHAWRRKVDQMTDDQVLAIWFRFRKTNKL